MVTKKKASAKSAAAAKEKPEVRVPKGLEVYNQDVAAEGFARILVMGPSKGGKTTSVLKTAPQPIIVLNGDGRNALRGASNAGAIFEAAHVVDSRSWRKAANYAYDLAEAGQVATIVLDTITLIVDTIYEEFRADKGTNFDMWIALYDTVMEPFRMLLDADCHLFVVAHHLPGADDDVVGIMPAIPGKAKVRIPSMIDDWVWLDVDAKKYTGDEVRGFLLGPQKNWSGSGRNFKGASKRIPADVGILFDELGIEP